VKRKKVEIPPPEKPFVYLKDGTPLYRGFKNGDPYFVVKKEKFKLRDYVAVKDNLVFCLNCGKSRYLTDSKVCVKCGSSKYILLVKALGLS
jgi:hypothetical protein